MARARAEYDPRITIRWIAQPRAEGRNSQDARLVAGIRARFCGGRTVGGDGSRSISSGGFAPKGRSIPR